MNPFLDWIFLRLEGMIVMFVNISISLIRKWSYPSNRDAILALFMLSFSSINFLSVARWAFPFSMKRYDDLFNFIPQKFKKGGVCIDTKIHINFIKSSLDFH